jgi:hypothetical protein
MIGGTATKDREEDEKDLVVKKVPIRKLLWNIPPFSETDFGFLFLLGIQIPTDVDKHPISEQATGEFIRRTT